ncbi:MAG: hypothetical protein RLO50_23285 [Azospirillaceae bacterium]
MRALAACLTTLLANATLLASAGAQLIPRQERPADSGAGESWLPWPLDALARTVNGWQTELGRTVNQTLGAMQVDGSAAAFATLCLIGFAYGVIHAVGPGHGKAVIAAFAAARRIDYRRTVLGAFTLAFTQAGVAIIGVGAAALILGASGPAIDSGALWFELFSYAAITGIGLWLLIRLISGREAGCGHDHAHLPPAGDGHDGHENHGHDRAHIHDHDHRHDHRDGHGHADDGGRPARGLTALAMLAGLRPCTGAVLILLFTAANGLLLAGSAAVLAMALGVGLTVSAVAIAAVFFRERMLALGGREGGLRRGIGRFVSLAGASVITLTGLAFGLGVLDRL